MSSQEVVSASTFLNFVRKQKKLIKSSDISKKGKHIYLNKPKSFKKPIIIYVLAEWCPHCIAKFELIMNLMKTNAKDFDVMVHMGGTNQSIQTDKVLNVTQFPSKYLVLPSDNRILNISRIV